MVTRTERIAVPMHGKAPWPWIGLGAAVAVIAVLAVLVILLVARSGTSGISSQPSADEAAQRFEGRNDLTDPAYQERVAAAGIADAEKRGWIPSGNPDLNSGFTKPAPTPKPEAVGPKKVKGNWSKFVMIEGKRHEIRYVETTSIKTSGLEVSYGLDSNDDPTFYLINKGKTTVFVTIFERDITPEGKIDEPEGRHQIDIRPNATEDYSISHLERSSTGITEVFLEVNKAPGPTTRIGGFFIN